MSAGRCCYDYGVRVIIIAAFDNNSLWSFYKKQVVVNNVEKL